MSDLKYDSSFPDLEEEEEEVYEVEQIIDHRKIGKKLQYYIKWKDYSSADNTWESEANVFADHLVDEYWADKGGREGLEVARKGKKLKTKATTASKGKQRQLPKTSPSSFSTSTSIASSSSSFSSSSFTPSLNSPSSSTKRIRTPGVSQQISEDNTPGSSKRARTDPIQVENDTIDNNEPIAINTSPTPLPPPTDQPAEQPTSSPQPESSTDAIAPSTTGASSPVEKQKASSPVMSAEYMTPEPIPEERPISIENDTAMGSENEMDINDVDHAEEASVVADIIKHIEKENDLFGNQNENTFDVETISPSLLETVPKGVSIVQTEKEKSPPTNYATSTVEEERQPQITVAEVDKEVTTTTTTTLKTNDKPIGQEVNSHLGNENNDVSWDFDMREETQKEQQENIPVKDIMLSPSNERETPGSLDKENILNEDNNNERDIMDDILDEPTSVVSPGALDDVMFDIMEQERYSLTPPVADSILISVSDKTSAVIEDQQPEETTINKVTESEKETQDHVMGDLTPMITHTTTTTSETTNKDINTTVSPPPTTNLEKETTTSNQWKEDSVTRMIPADAVSLKGMSEIDMDDVIYDDNFPENQEDWINVKEVVTVIKAPPASPDGEIFALVRWKNNILSMHPSQDVRKYCTAQLIDFYERNIKFR